MTRTIRHVSTAVLAATFLTALGFGAPVSAAPAQVQDLRVGEHPNATRVVLDLSEPTEMTIAVSEDGRTIIVDLPGVEWRAGTFRPKHDKGSLQGFSFQNGQLNIAMRESVRIRPPFFVAPEGTQGHRMVIDVVADAPAAAAKASAPRQLGGTVMMEPPQDVAMVERMVAGPANIGAPAAQPAASSSMGASARVAEVAQAAPPRPQPQPQMAPMAPAQPMANPRGPLGGMMYLKGGFGITKLEEADATGSGNNAAVESEIGWAAVGGLGIDLRNNFRVEGEVLYAVNDVQSVRGTVNGAAATSGAVNGDTSTLAFMANAAYDFANPYAITPYIFGGAGIARVSLNGISPPNNAGLDDEEWTFAMQGGIGAVFDINERLSLDAGYRYFETMELELVDANGQPFNYENAMHLFLLSARYKF